MGIRLRSFLILFALATLGYLQYLYWWGEAGFDDMQQLQQDLNHQTLANQAQLNENAILAAEVNDLKNGLEAIEEHARLDLGLIKPNETFIQMSDIPQETLSSP